MKLFRDEVQQQQSAFWLGTVRLARPIGFATVTGFAVVVLILVAAFAGLGQVTRKARLSGVLVAAEGSVNVAAQQNGIVLERRVREGDRVHAGDILLTVNVDRQSLGGSAVENTAAAMAGQIRRRKQLTESAHLLGVSRIERQRAFTQEKLHGLDAEIDLMADALRLQERKVALEEEHVGRLEALAEDGYVPEVRLREKREAHLDSMSQLQTLMRNRAALKRERTDLRGRLDDLSAQLFSEKNSIETQLSNLKQEALEIDGRRTLVITAPCDGAITGIDIKQAQYVVAGQTLLTLLPTARNGKALEAHLFAPSRTAGFVQPGQGVYIRYAAYPFQKFGMFPGRITAISGTPFFPNELPPNLAQQLLAQNGSVEGLYRISVELDDQAIHAYGATLPLKPGFVLEADIVQARLRIWELIFEPLLAIRARMIAAAVHPESGTARTSTWQVGMARGVLPKMEGRI